MILKGMLLRRAPRRSRRRQLSGRAASAVGANAEVAVSDVVGCVANLVEKWLVVPVFRERDRGFVDYLRDPDQRKLLLSGLRLAADEVA
jgi:hypothetical protein